MLIFRAWATCVRLNKIITKGNFKMPWYFYHILAPSSLKKCVEVSLGNDGVFLNNRGQ